ncbi:ABC transporter type 1 transmembrane domain [Trinorchestia longiramus]|nr:ABC transporter type 1 transmembrane domain [Trinorchestia longiramus]
MENTGYDDGREVENDTKFENSGQTLGSVRDNSISIPSAATGTSNLAFEPDEGCDAPTRPSSPRFHRSDHISLNIPPDIKTDKFQVERRLSSADKRRISDAFSDYGEEKCKPTKVVAKPTIGVLQLFQFTTFKERVLLCIGVLAALVTTLCMPVMIILFGNVTKEFVNNAIYSAKQKETLFPDGVDGMNGTQSSNDEHTDETLVDHLIYFSVGTALFWLVQIFCTYVYVASFNIVGERQTHRIRTLLLRVTLSQEMSWFDTRASNDFASKTSECEVRTFANMIKCD